MKLTKALLGIAGAMVATSVLAVGVLDLWSNLDQEEHVYVDNNWLGGTVEIQAVADEEDEAMLQLRIKMTGAGSIPANRSLYFVGTAEQGGELPVVSDLKKTNSQWKVLPRQGNNGSIEIEAGDRSELTGDLQGYGFTAEAVQIEEEDQ